MMHRVQSIGVTDRLLLKESIEVGKLGTMEHDDQGDSYYDGSEWDDSRSWVGDHETMDYV